MTARFRSLTLALLLSSPLLVTAAGAQANDPWAVLQGVRQSLAEAGPTEASFTQIYIPAGFSSGERENGRLSLALPDCLRWDYREPYPKSFLLCGAVAHQWNPEDQTGRRFRVDRKNEPGLDLLLLGLEDLKARYGAMAKRTGNGQVEIALTPRGKVAELTDALLTIDPASQHLVGLSYHDREGNLTRFEIAQYRTLPRQGQFSPPPGIRWDEQ
ncbi:MAG: outer membrane lipoprotein carrier protein LolA [Acidobacteriota bacterium]|nr:outer membrane lipoprotein carrier protein LolA [Acidobacteriota bacterium]